VDWRVVWTSSDDPIPGYPDTVARGGAEYQSNGRAIRNAIDYLDRLSLEEIKSDSVAKLADQMRTVRAELDRVEERVNGAGNALVDYAEKFRGYQKQTMALWEEADALQSQLDSTNGDLAALKRHADRLGDSDEDEKKRVGEQMAAASNDAKRIASALAPLRRQFADAVSAQRTSAEILKGTLQAIDDTTPGKDSFWDKVQSWVNQIVTAVFEAVMNLIKAAVELLIEALKAIVAILVAILIVLAVAIVVGLLLTHPLLILFGALALYYSQHPDIVIAGALMLAQGGLIFMALAQAKRRTRGEFKDCDQDAATIDENIKLLQCAGAAEHPEAYTGGDYEVVTDPEELSKLGITESMLVDERSGFKATVFRVPGTDQYVVGFAGTNFDDPDDVVTDALGSQGVTEQDMMAMRLATAIGGSAVAGSVTYVGHSLGGRLAAVAAITSGRPAVTYDPAGTSDAVVAQALAYRDGGNVVAATEDLVTAGQNVTVYRTAHDPLNMAQETPGLNELAPPAFGDHRYTVYDSNIPTVNDVSDLGDFFKDGHDQGSMKQGLKNAKAVASH
jgi:hypothetical protein